MMLGREILVIYLKGLCMGAADSVPGVSGGTIALITGIYERLITAIAGLDPRVLEHVTRLHTAEGREKLRDDLIEMEVPFLMALGLGIVTAIAIMATVLHAAIESYPVLTAAFFFGLIAAGAVVLVRYVSLGTPGRILVCLGGLGLALFITGFSKGNGMTPSLLIIFLTGTLAISAMVLPGISGAFILYMLGLYEYMSGVPKEFLSSLVGLAGGDSSGLVTSGTEIAAFGMGAVIGLLTITHAIKYALEQYRKATLTFLVSLMVGSLRAPATEIVAHGELTPERVVGILIAVIVGGSLVVLLDRFTENIEFEAGSDVNNPDHERSTAAVND